MNILFVTPDYVVKYKPTTGLPSYLRRVAISLVGYGHRPIIVTAGIADQHEVVDGIEIYTKSVNHLVIKNNCFDCTVNALLMGYELNRLVHNICKKVKVDLIQYTSLNGLGIFYHENCPAVLRLSSYAKMVHLSGETYTKAAIRSLAFLERLSSKRMRSIFAPSKIVAENFGKDIGRRVAVIESPFVNDVKDMDYGLYNSELNGKKYVLYFGVLSAEKGMLVIRKLLHEFLKIYPDYYFVLIGECRAYRGESCLSLIKRAAGECRDRLLYFPPQRHERLYPIIENADFIVLPSLMENFSNACIEAMSFGKIVIGTENTSFEQLIREGENGFLSRPGDSKSLLEKMSQAVNLTEEERGGMEERARKRVDLLSPEHTVKKLLRFYETCERSL